MWYRVTEWKTQPSCHIQELRDFQIGLKVICALRGLHGPIIEPMDQKQYQVFSTQSCKTSNHLLSLHGPSIAIIKTKASHSRKPFFERSELRGSVNAQWKPLQLVKPIYTHAIKASPRCWGLPLSCLSRHRHAAQPPHRPSRCPTWHILSLQLESVKPAPSQLRRDTLHHLRRPPATHPATIALGCSPCLWGHRAP